MALKMKICHWYDSMNSFHGIHLNSKEFKAHFFCPFSEVFS